MANLSVQPNVKEAFAKAGLRVVRAKIEREDIVLVSTSPCSGSLEEDFRALVEESGAAGGQPEPSFYLVALDGTGEEWFLVAMVDDALAVREKMLYASSHKSLVNQLGSGKFKGELYCNCASDFTYDNFAAALRSDKSDAPLTEAEAILKAEAQQTIGTQASAGNVSLAFPIEQAAQDALAQFAAGELSFVSMEVSADESVCLDKAEAVESNDALSAALDAQNARFYCVRFPFQATANTLNFLVLSCPESDGGNQREMLKQRFVLATVKATVQEYCASKGIEIKKVVETQEPSSLVADLESEIKSATESRAINNDQAFSKPKRPGRGKRRLIKKKK